MFIKSIKRNYDKVAADDSIADQDKIDAEFKDGCLKITVPKKEEVENKKVIEIK